MKVGLISVSGIRIHDEKLYSFGLTLPGFVERGEVIASLPTLGLLTLAGMTSDVEHVYYDIPDWKAINKIPDDFDLAAISSLSASINEAYELSQYYRNIGIPTVMGGLHVSTCPTEAIHYCDAVVIGEGENVWPTLVRDFEKGQMKLFYGELFNDFDLSNAPMPAFELLDIEKYNRLTVQTQRGCPHLCEFCGTSVLYTNKYKRKPIKKIINEIHKIKEIWSTPFIELADDNSVMSGDYGKQLLRELAKEKIKWFTETDIHVARNDEYLKLLSESGCRQILIGLESPDANTMEGLEIKNNWKMRKVEGYKDDIRKIQSYGITVNGCFILGLDTQGPGIFDKVYDFIKETELYETQLTLLTPFPGTALYNRLKNENRLLKQEAWERCTLFDLNFVPKKMSVDELKSGFTDLLKRTYDASFVKERRNSFYSNYKGSIKKRANQKNRTT